MLYRLCLAVAVVTSILFHSYAPVINAEAGTITDKVDIRLTVNDESAMVNGRTMKLSTPPVLVHNTTLVPLRFIADALKADLTWHAEERSITIQYADHTIKLSIDDRNVRVDQQMLTLEQPAVIVNNTTMVPLRFIAESLNQDVAFDPETQSVVITTPRQPAQESQRDVTTKPRQPAQESQTVVTAALKQRAQQIRIDNLTTASDMGFNYNFYFERPNMKVISMAADRHHQVYILEQHAASEMSFVLRVYNEVTGEMKVLFSQFNESFDFDYTDSKLREGHFDAGVLSPHKIFYDTKLDKLFLLASSSFASDTGVSTVIYEIAPKVQMMTYTIGNMTYHPGNFVATPDGKRFYFSDILHHTIYAGESGKEAKAMSPYSYDGDKVKLAAVVKDGSMFVLDMAKQAVYELQEGANLKYVAPIDIKEEITWIYEADGVFYAAGERQIWEVSTAGETRPYIGMKDISGINQGLYLPKTGTYDENAFFNKGAAYGAPLSFGYFAINENGNVVMYDRQYHLLRRVNIYEQ
ncbi:copper amine oxidase N-terminal domain-containing protein [Paenibacillus chartarius]|uniref:Copper amine oxidase N-terminal domain-containing protein n=1 Tax=Paenibacillus chartarius TaxID=747481 RepID=A0ABV6DL73_9BACL